MKFSQRKLISNGATIKDNKYLQNIITLDPDRMNHLGRNNWRLSK